jgi:hypothetical protein
MTQGTCRTNILDYGYELIDLTPELAKRYLDSMPVNRIRRKPIADQYARDMRAGRFEADPAWPIVVDANNLLREGQHRCHAVLETGITVQVWRRVMNLRQLEIMHTTLPRKLADSLVIGYQLKSADIVASSARLVSRRLIRPLHVSNTNTQQGCMGAHEVMELYDRYGIEPQRLATTAKRVYKQQLAFKKKLTYAHIGYMLFQRPDLEDWLLALLGEAGNRTPSQLAVRKALQTGVRGRSKADKGWPTLYGLALASEAMNQPNCGKLQGLNYVPDLVGGCFDKEAA